MKKEKETTLDTLARMMADGFASADKRFDAVDERFDRLEGEVRATNNRIDTIIIPTIDDHSRRIKDLELAK